MRVVVLFVCLFSPFPQQQKNLEGYVGFASLPNQVYRKSVKRGFEFTLMVVGKRSRLSLRAARNLRLVPRRTAVIKPVSATSQATALSTLVVNAARVKPHRKPA